MAKQNVISGEAGNSPLDQVPGLRQLMLLLAIAAAVAVGVWAVLWMEEEQHTVLFSNLSDSDAVEIVQALDSAGISNQYRPGSGAVMVPRDQVHSARLHLASQELPATGGVGFEIFEQGNGFSDSQFIESARYQRALEVELQRTIGTIRAVRSARVHLAVPRPTVFVRDRQPASASVLLNLHSGRRLESGQVESIANLVASSVPEMESAQVTVVDESGNLLSERPASKDENSQSLGEQRMRRLEALYRNRIEELLTPLVGRDRVQAQVAVSVSSETIEETQEIYDDQNQVIRSEQISEQTGRAELARGIPGALSNRPPATTDEPSPGIAGGGDAEPPDADRPVPRQSEALRNFEIGRTIRHIQQPLGDIRRISAAVIVDQKRVTNDEGEVELVPYSAEELERMTELVRQAIGFSEERNDRVSVVNAAFQLREESGGNELPDESLLDRLDWVGLLRTASIAVLLLLLIFAVIRPTLRQLVMTLPPRTMALPPASGHRLADQTGENAESGDQPENAAPRPSRHPYDEKITTARTIVKEDPKRVAQVVRQWVTEDGG